jgi:hypothetical protein
MVGAFADVAKIDEKSAVAICRTDNGTLRFANRSMSNAPRWDSRPLQHVPSYIANEHSLVAADPLLAPLSPFKGTGPLKPEHGSCAMTVRYRTKSKSF